MEKIISALVASSRDYGESDRIVTLLTADSGVIRAVMRGTHKPKAKLKLASQQFTLGEYSMSYKSNRYCVTNCNILDSFYDLVLDPIKYCCGCVIVEVVEIMLADSQTVVDMLKILKSLLYDNINPIILLLHFLSSTMVRAGMALTNVIVDKDYVATDEVVKERVKKCFLWMEKLLNQKIISATSLLQLL